ncbi:ATP-binding protein [Leucobacter tenebrionis]|uniref:ATP-binding protein n=1 Tax=Leucobacter tenebrionis TaxID=2873270 RepID=UPI001CA65214|nr:ATP-binding protein [Leucobacter tenebrionis]QZY51145.1 PAS domain-containing protein [Leucobacter tenebrionis]
MTSSRTARPFSGALVGVQLAVVAITVALVAGVGVMRAVGEAESAAEQRIQDVADTIRRLPVVISAMQGEDPSGEIQPIVDAALTASGFQYITVADLNGIRVAHVDPERVGEPVSSDHGPIRDGAEFRGVETGPQGVTYRVKLPITAENGEVVGTISVGELVSEIRHQALAQSLPIALASLGSILLGALLAWLIARWLRRELYGVEPEQLVSLLQAHQAVMASGHEGVVTVDTAGRIQLVNAEAARLLGLDPEAAEALIGEEARVLPASIRDILADGAESHHAHLRRLGDFNVYAQAAEVRHCDRPVGRMVSLRDRTELDRAAARLQAERAEAELLRIEAHEFENRMHLVAGLIELGEYDEARSYLESAQDLRPVPSIEVPVLAAFISARIGVAAREHVTLELEGSSSVASDWPVFDEDLLVVANLVNNAVEATGFGGTVRLLLSGDEEAGVLQIRVDDDGPGFGDNPGGLLRRGVTTKEDGARHGIGLDSVNRAVSGRGGRLEFGASDLGGGSVIAALPLPGSSSGSDSPVSLAGTDARERNGTTEDHRGETA